MSDSNQARELRLEEAFVEYSRRVDTGQSVDINEFLYRYADVADELQECLETAELIECMAGPTVAEYSQLVSSIDTRDSKSVSETGASKCHATKLLRVPCEFGRYNIQKLLGRGAMGAVYLAFDTQLQRQVAIKVSTPLDGQAQVFEDRLVREARAAAALRSPYICPVYDVGQHEGVYFISMAYLDGETLSQQIRKRSVPPRAICQLLAKLATGLEIAHRNGVIHRDLKPANIIINAQGEPSIMDFGLALYRDQATIRQTARGELIGSPAYMSPEQVAAVPEEIGPATDIYSLGIVLYELLTGELPFKGNMASVITQIILDEPQPPSQLEPNVDRHLESICLKMIAKRSEQRYESMSEVVHACNTLVLDTEPSVDESSGGSNASQHAPASESLSFAGGLRKTVLLVGSFVAAALVVVATVLYIQWGKSTLRFEIHDPSLAVLFADQQITVHNDGEAIKILPETENSFVVEHDGLEVQSRSFVLKKGKHITLRVALLKGVVDVDPSDPAVRLRGNQKPHVCPMLEVSRGSGKLLSFVDHTTGIPRMIGTLESPQGESMRTELQFVPTQLNDVLTTRWKKAVIVDSVDGPRMILGVTEAGTPRVVRTAPGNAGSQIAEEAVWRVCNFDEVAATTTRGRGCRFEELCVRVGGDALILTISGDGQPRIIRTMNRHHRAEEAVFR